MVIIFLNILLLFLFILYYFHVEYFFVFILKPKRTTQVRKPALLLHIVSLASVVVVVVFNALINVVGSL